MHPRPHGYPDSETLSLITVLAALAFLHLIRTMQTMSPSIDSLPTLTLKNEKNEDILVADLASENGVVLFLVPKADTRKVILSFQKHGCLTDSDMLIL
jgi:hypothetical protein